MRKRGERAVQPNEADKLCLLKYGTPCVSAGGSINLRFGLRHYKYLNQKFQPTFFTIIWFFRSQSGDVVFLSQ